MKSHIQAYNESGGVVINITTWTPGRETGLSAGIIVASVLAAVLGCSCTALWFLSNETIARWRGGTDAKGASRDLSTAMDDVAKIE
ncbi:hypothetical protein J3R83DRAFT_5300 [Lanmaoa asiatica]|nr:hypothetical protein J3R83DRAFT_5300 [Lanmaoa asiatica]